MIRKNLQESDLAKNIAAEIHPERNLHCEHFRSQRCRSCSLLDNSYDATLQQKFDILRQTFRDTRISAFVPCQKVRGSRIRAKVAVTGTQADPQIGFYNDKQTVVSVNDCTLHHPLINEWTQRLPSIIRDARLMPYDIRADRGELKFVNFTCSPVSGQLMIQFVLRSREAVDRIRRLWHRMTNAERQAVPVMSVNLQPMRTSTIAGIEEIAISEQQWLAIDFDGTELLFGPQSFIQTNYAIAVELYAAAGRKLLELSARNVLDLYCGVGAFSLTACSHARSVIGIDVSRNAIDCATEAVHRNKRSNVHFLCRGLDQLTADQLVADSIDTIICNPPRRGLDPASVTLIRKLHPEYFLYSSCNPATLQRDMQLLAPDYELEHIQPFDMFPYTHHCEVLALFLHRRR